MKQIVYSLNAAYISEEKEVSQFFEDEKTFYFAKEQKVETLSQRQAHDERTIEEMLGDGDEVFSLRDSCSGRIQRF